MFVHKLSLICLLVFQVFDLSHTYHSPYGGDYDDYLSAAHFHRQYMNEPFGGEGYGYGYGYGPHYWAIGRPLGGHGYNSMGGIRRNRGYKRINEEREEYGIPYRSFVKSFNAFDDDEDFGGKWGKRRRIGKRGIRGKRKAKRKRMNDDYDQDNRRYRWGNNEEQEEPMMGQLYKKRKLAKEEKEMERAIRMKEERIAKLAINHDPMNISFLPEGNTLFRKRR